MPEAASIHAGEGGHLNQPGCTVYTSGAVVLLLATDARASAVTDLERTLAAAVGAKSASALMRRVSSSVLRLDVADALPGKAQFGADRARSQAVAADSAVQHGGREAAASEQAGGDAGTAHGVQADDVQGWAAAETGGTPAEPDESADSTAAVAPERRDSVGSEGSTDSAASEQTAHVEL